MTPLSTGHPALDEALGGGWARGRILEVFGRNAVGPRALLLAACASMRASGLPVAYVDVEHALEPAQAAALDIVCQPDDGDQAVDIVDALTRSGAVGLVVVDSVAGLVPQLALGGDITLGLHARMMSQAMRKIVGVAERAGVTLLFANRLYTHRRTFGSWETTCGGNALKYFASQRVEVVDGRARVVKNRFAPPFVTCELTL